MRPSLSQSFYIFSFSMKYIKIFFISAICSAIVFYGSAFFMIQAPIKGGYWINEMVIIKTYLANRYVDKQKIIVTGGSSTLFGIDTAYASKALDKPVINFGLTAGTELKKLFKSVSKVLSPKDIVIILLEPTYWECGNKGFQTNIRDVIAWDHETWDEATPIEKLNLLSLVSPGLWLEIVGTELFYYLVPELFEERLQSKDKDAVLAKFENRKLFDQFAYSAYNMDEYGTILKTEANLWHGKDDDLNKPAYICAKTLSDIKVFIAEMRQKGVKVYFANTPYPVSNPETQEWEVTEQTFKSQIDTLSCIIDKRLDLVFDQSMFFNSHLHLNTKGRLVRTQKLVESIRHNIMQNDCAKQ